MKIGDFIVVPKNSKDTTSCGTTYSGQPTASAQDIVPQMVDNKILEMPDHSAITEGVSQIFRRKKGGAPAKGFRCTSGHRKGRIVAQPSTCFARLDPKKSAKIRAKRSIKAKQAGKKLAITKRSGPGARRLKGVQIKKRKGSAPRLGKARTGHRAPLKSKIVKPK